MNEYEILNIVERYEKNNTRYYYDINAISETGNKINLVSVDVEKKKAKGLELLKNQIIVAKENNYDALEVIIYTDMEKMNNQRYEIRLKPKSSIASNLGSFSLGNINQNTGDFGSILQKSVKSELLERENMTMRLAIEKLENEKNKLKEDVENYKDKIRDTEIETVKSNNNKELVATLGNIAGAFFTNNMNLNANNNQLGQVPQKTQEPQEFTPDFFENDKILKNIWRQIENTNEEQQNLILEILRYALISDNNMAAIYNTIEATE